MRRIPNPHGRPRKQGEILSEERAIKFAPSMMEGLQQESAKSGVSVAEIVRRAVAGKLEGRLLDEKELKERVRRLTEQATRDSICVDLKETERNEIMEMAESIGFDGPEDLLKLIARQAIKLGPDRVREFLLEKPDSVLTAEDKKLVEEIKESVVNNTARVKALMEKHEQQQQKSA